MNINSVSDFRRAYDRGLGKYAWPGGYPCYWLMADGGALAFDVARAELRSFLHAITYPEYRDNQWRPIALAINWEDSNLYCDHTGARIESAYAD